MLESKYSYISGTNPFTMDLVLGLHFHAANLVYKFTCQCDTDITYIGETNRHIGVRAGEHLDLSKPGKVSPVGKHISSCEVCFTKLSQGALTFKDFEILKQCRSKLMQKLMRHFSSKSFDQKSTLNSLKVVLASC